MAKTRDPNAAAAEQPKPTPEMTASASGAEPPTKAECQNKGEDVAEGKEESVVTQTKEEEVKSLPA
jgi:hypothetical protein